MSHAINFNPFKGYAPHERDVRDRKVREQIKGLVVVVPDPQLLIAPRWTLLGGTPIQPGKVPTGDVDLASLRYQLLESVAHAVMIA